MIIKRKTNNKIVAAKRRAAAIKASTTNKIPYDLVSTLVILRDYAEVEDSDYVNGEHRKLVDIADSIYNADISPESMYDEYKKLYNEYGDEYFDEVLQDVRAIDSQISRRNIDDLIEDFNDKLAAFKGVDAACGKKSIKSSRMSVKASTSDMRTQFQSFLDKVDRELDSALFQYGDAVWSVKGTMSNDENGYWFELNLYCDGEEAGTVNIEVDTSSNYRTSTDEYVVSVSDSDEIQAEGNSFDDILDTCVGELIRLAEDYENFVRIAETTKLISAGEQFKKEYGLKDDTAASFMEKYKIKAKNVDFEHGDGSVIHFGIGTREEFVNKYKNKKIKDVYNKYGMTIFVLDD